MACTVPVGAQGHVTGNFSSWNVFWFLLKFQNLLIDHNGFVGQDSVRIDWTLVATISAASAKEVVRTMATLHPGLTGKCEAAALPRSRGLQARHGRLGILGIESSVQSPWHAQLRH